MSNRKDQFFMRQRANEGIQVPLYSPTGEKTDEWLLVRGKDSDAVRLAHAASSRRMVEAAALAKSTGKPIDADALAEEERLNIIVAIVAGWSFEDKCTPEAVKAFLKEAPQIADMLDSLSARRAAFFKVPSVSSVSLHQKTSG